MLILILIDFRYSQNVVLSVEKGSNGQNHSLSDSSHPINSPAKIPITPLGESDLENPAMEELSGELRLY